MTWVDLVLNFLGILIYFINRFFKRADTSVPFQWNFWLRDNWQEASTTVLLNASFMLILYKLIHTDSIATVLAKLPDWLTILGIPGICFGLGLGLSSALYEMFKSKKDTIVPKP